MSVRRTSVVKPRPFLPSPRWVGEAEARVGRWLPVHPLVLSLIKLLVVTPLIVAVLGNILPAGTTGLSALFVVFFLLDYLEVLVSAQRTDLPHWSHLVDRASDYPLLFAVAHFAVDYGVVPIPILALKVGLDVLLLLLFAFGRGTKENRLRTGIGYAALMALALLTAGSSNRVLNPQAVIYLLWVNIAFLATTAAFYVGLLQKRFVADALSAANLLCGIFSMLFASRGRFELSLLFVILGAAFDGFDGAAARRWGGTKFGVYSDDIADGTNYGIAPGVALYFALGGISGILVGTFYAVFTITRLLFFTLNKSGSDPNYFAGVPSPVGGLVAMASIVAFREQPGVLGLLIGIACAQMVSFSTHYRHLGRAMATHRRAILGAPLYLVVLLLGLRFGGARGASAVILVGNLVYGFLPTARAFMEVLADRRTREPSGLTPVPRDPTPLPEEPPPHSAPEGRGTNSASEGRGTNSSP